MFFTHPESQNLYELDEILKSFKICYLWSKNSLLMSVSGGHQDHRQKSTGFNESRKGLSRSRDNETIRTSTYR